MSKRRNSSYLDASKLEERERDRVGRTIFSVANSLSEIDFTKFEGKVYSISFNWTLQSYVDKAKLSMPFQKSIRVGTTDCFTSEEDAYFDFFETECIMITPCH